MRLLSTIFAFVCAVTALGTSSAQIGGSSLGATLGVEPKEESLVSASMASSVMSYEKGKPFYISYTVTAQKPWHVYYRNPGTVGLVPEINLQLPEGFSATGPYWQIPKREEGKIGVFYGYSALSFVWEITPSQQAGTSVSFAADSVTQACNDEGCSPPLPAQATLALAAGDAAPNPAWQGMEKKVEILGDTPIEIRVTQQSPQTLVMEFDTEQPLDFAYFFSDDNVTAPHQAQTLTRSGNTNTLVMPRNDNEDTLYPAPETPALDAPVTQLKGILVYGDKHMKVDVAVSAASATAAASAQAGMGSMPSGFWGIVIGLFLGGLILNLMPCVFPVIGLKIMSFVELAGGSRRKVFLHSSAFTLGVIVSFWALCLILILLSNLDALAQSSWTQWVNVLLSDTGAASRSWAVWMENPWVIYSLILLFLGLGLSMFGVFEFGVSATGAGQNLQQKSGLAGSFFSGLLATVVATPCSAPFLGPALPAAMTMPAIWMIAAMSFMAIGLSFPYIVIGIVPRFVRFLPRPGAWMESLKQGLSFLLFAAVAWLVSVYIVFIPEAYESDLIWMFVGFVVVASAFWVYGRWCPMYRDRSTRRIGAVCAVALLATGIIMTIPRDEPSAAELSARPQWETWSPAAMQQALDEGKPVFVDFTAKWCMTCQFNKKVAYTDAVYDKMKELGIVLMRADKSRPNADIDAELHRLKRTSIPVNALYQKGQEPVITTELITPNYLIDFFDTHVKKP